MLTILFWNTARRDLSSLIREVVAEHTPELVVLAESSAKASILSVSLSQTVAGAYRVIRTPSRVSRPLQILSRLPAGRVFHVQESRDLTALRVDPVVGPELLVCGVHLPSKLHLEDAEQALLATRLRKEVEELERRRGHARTLLVGDFNMNPFEHGIVGSESLHAVPGRKVAMRGSRVVSGDERRFFYNPMWRFFGDSDSSPGGTYYRGDSSPVCYFWNVFDQVLIRPGIIEALPGDGVGVLSSVGDDVSLLTSSGIPNSKDFSDHLPLLIRLRALKGDRDVAA